MGSLHKQTALFILCLLCSSFLYSQHKVLMGYVKDAQSDERIPFASIQFVQSGAGKLSGPDGSFIFTMTEWPRDTLRVSYVGYDDYSVAIDEDLLQRVMQDTLKLVIGMDRGIYSDAVVVSRKIDRGLMLWKKIVRRKSANDRYRFNNFSYELYNKLELDINKLKFDKLKDWGILKPFKFIIEQNVDSSEGAPFLPVYLTETISDYYAQNSPFKTREIIKGSKTMGIENESVSRLLGGTDQNVNIYSNFIPVFDKQFVSPISDNGDAYYRYRIADTQYVDSRRLIHLIFTPKHKGGNTFVGDCWVHDTSFAIQKMTLYLSKEANINFVDKLSLIQEYRLVSDSIWFLSKDKFVVNVSAISKQKLGAIGRKTTTYRNVAINDPAITEELDKNTLKFEVLLREGAREQADSYWQESRHESLSKTERSIYAMIDTLEKMPVFKRYTNTLNFLVTGYGNVGKFQIGPWYNWISGNTLEGTRLRFDLGTNKHFNKNLLLHGYLAYGFTDKKFKYKLDGMYLFKKHPRSMLYASYTDDLDNGQTYYDEISTDNIFALAVRKPRIPIKFIHVKEKKLEYYHETKSGFSATFSTVHKEYDPLKNLPPKDLFSATRGEALNNFEASVKLRFAYMEKFLETNFYRVSLGSPYPITELKYSRGIPGLLNSNYTYSKWQGSISDYIKIPPFGNLYYNVFGGKIYGTLPYMLLEVHPGNEIYYYNKYAFNLMNRFEYISDQYIGFNIEHNIGNGLFKFIPITRKLKFRQFWTAKGVAGSLNQSNAQLNLTNPYQEFQTLNNKMYLEVGTGVDNILKVLRVDFVWRLSPTPLPKESVKRFGIFGSFRLSF